MGWRISNGHKGGGRDRSWYAFTPVAVLTILLIVSAGLWWRDQAFIEDAQRTDFEHRRNAIRSEVLSRLNRIRDLLWSLRAEFGEAPDISVDRWHRFIERIDVSQRFQGISGIGLVAYVPTIDLPGFLAARRQETLDFTIFPADGHSDHMILSFIAPPSLNHALGYDSGTSPERRAAMERARDTGRTIFSAKVEVMTGGDVVAYLPIYLPGRPADTLDERRAAIRGWAAIAFSMATLMDGVVKPGEPTDLEIYDGVISPHNLMLDTDSHHLNPTNGARKLESQQVLEVGGRSLTLYVAALGRTPVPFVSSAIVLAIGSFGGLFLVILMQKIVSTLRVKEERLRLVLESSNDGFWDWDIVSGTTFFSPHFAAMLGYSTDDILPTRESWEAIVHPDDKPAIRQRFIAHFHGLTPRIEHEYRMLNSAGNWIWVRETAAVVGRDGERATRMSGMISDVSERRKSEDRLRLLSTVIEESPASVVITDAAGIIFYVNRTFETASGYSYDEVFGHKPAILASGLTDKSVYDQMWATIITGCKWRGELCNRRKNGDLYWEDALITQVRGSDGGIFYVGVKVDITDKKRTEDVLLRSQKMEAIGTLAGGIAHDFNNILTSILGFNHLILGDAGNSGAIAGHVRQIHLAASRAKDLVRQILTFSRQMPTQKLAVDLGAIVNEVYQLVRTTAPASIKVMIDLPSGRALVLGTTIQLHQVLMNLCLNAIDAIGDRNGMVAIALERREGDFELSVTDSGCGISPEVQPRIFDPFFTTKAPGKGEGLGLSVVHGVVEDLGGAISMETPAEGGTRFVIRLPELLGVAEESEVIESLPCAPASAHARHILVVDDDPAIVDLLCQFFERMGHRVSTSTVSSEALARIRGGDRFDIVISDQMMPGITGIALAGAVAECAPGTKVLLCSGRDDNIDYDEVATARIDGFVLKPFNLIELADTVECLLRGVEGGG